VAARQNRRTGVAWAAQEGRRQQLYPPLPMNEASAGNHDGMGGRPPPSAALAISAGRRADGRSWYYGETQARGHALSPPTCDSPAPRRRPQVEAPVRVNEDRPISHSFDGSRWPRRHRARGPGSTAPRAPDRPLGSPAWSTGAPASSRSERVGGTTLVCCRVEAACRTADTGRWPGAGFPGEIRDR